MGHQAGNGGLAGSRRRCCRQQLGAVGRPDGVVVGLGGGIEDDRVTLRGFRPAVEFIAENPEFELGAVRLGELGGKTGGAVRGGGDGGDGQGPDHREGNDGAG